MSRGNTGVTDPEIHALACPVREVIDRVGGKWSVQIILAVTNGPVRFTELERRIDGISRRMLSLTLRNLERDGLVQRTVYPTVPARVEYTATDLARELHAPLEGLAEWALRNLDNIAAAQAAYDSDRSSLPT
ncbi:winged helix-turn-helix transcriptional regulator [Streptomyces sp. P6-2-1]|uniref:winged helix-turn-helix transcriptional regulator n=1 Tax=unclassified Streptomyces TaxID=2593676 RepID=UPI003D36D4CA